MLWTTKQKDGSFRSIDTENCSLLDIGIEFALMRREKLDKKQTRKDVQ